MYGDFILIGEGHAAKVVPRSHIGDLDGKDEAWLRDTIFTTPQILPVSEIDPTFGPLVPLCTELRTPAGPVDAVFINEHGRLTIVECMPMPFAPATAQKASEDQRLTLMTCVGASPASSR